MNPYYDSGGITIYNGDCREVLPTLPSNSIDSIVTDPPYELGFMNKQWDKTGIAFNIDLWRECLRVLKPGGYLLAFGGTRTYHRMVCAIEDAGFEIKDQIDWLYATGFPKSLNVSKAIDNMKGAKREVVGKYRVGGNALTPTSQKGGTYGVGVPNSPPGFLPITVPATPEAKQWDGFGTALKPAHEPICLARKPLEGTVAENVLKWGVGGLNIDECRIATTDNLNGGAYAKQGTLRDDGWHMQRGGAGEYKQPKGRWPANVLFDEPAAEMLDKQSGERPGMKRGVLRRGASTGTSIGGHGKYGTSIPQEVTAGYNDSGGASRFFYVAKASRSERWFYCNDCQDAFPPSEKEEHWHGHVNEKGEKTWVHLESHPTQKPLQLIRYLVRLVTPPNGKVLDPFAGSGTTGLACQMEGFSYILIERDPHFIDIIHRRLDSSTR